MVSFTKQRGLTLVELMVSMAVGLFIVVVATVVLVSAKASYQVQADSAQILDTGRHAIDIVSRNIRQASYLNWDMADAGTVVAAEKGAAVFGLDARSLNSRTAGISSPLTRSINGSDVLAVRFAGSGNGSNGDGTVLNCAGFGVGVGNAKGLDERGWSIFYVAEDSSGEPELYCKYRGEEGWASQAIARGVESFQVLYALDPDGDGYPNMLVNAATVDAMDNEAAGSTGKAGAGLAGSGRHTHWKNVVAVKVAVLIRGAHSMREEEHDRQYDLFGAMYSNAYSVRDRGVRVRPAELPKAIRARARKIFATTIWLHTRPVGA